MDYIASLCICNDLALCIYDIEYGIDDRIIIGYSNESKKHKCKIYYNLKGDPYMIFNGRRYYINEFMRKEVY